MNRSKLWGLKALAFVATLVAAGTISPPAEAGGWYHHPREPRHYYQDYGSYAPGYWYNDYRDGYRRGWDARYAADPYGAGWRWCPELRRYVPAYGRWQRYRSRDEVDAYGYWVPGHRDRICRYRCYDGYW